jgi:hypothetical protein
LQIVLHRIVSNVAVHPLGSRLCEPPLISSDQVTNILAHRAKIAQLGLALNECKERFGHRNIDYLSHIGLSSLFGFVLQV